MKEIKKKDVQSDTNEEKRNEKRVKEGERKKSLGGARIDHPCATKPFYQILDGCSRIMS